MRKMKPRMVVPDQVAEAALAEIDTPPCTAPENLSSAMPASDACASAYALDDWCMAYDPLHSAPMAQVEAEIAADMERKLEAEPDDPASVGAASSAGSEDLIRQFFATDLDSEPCGMRAEEYVMLRELRQDVEVREALTVQGNKAEAEAAEVSAAATSARERLADLEECGRAYCGDFLREPMGISYGERPCRRGGMCVFKLMAARYPDSAARDSTDEGFVCREFLLPSHVAEFAKSRNLPKQQRLCLGCNRLLTHFYYHYYRSRDREPKFLLQDHAIIVDSPGEYSSSDCIYPNPDEGKWTGIVRPIVRYSAQWFAFCPFNVTTGDAADVQTRVLKGAREMHMDFRPASAVGRRA